MFDVIFSYSRAQAIADGTLIDVTAAAKQLFKWPTAISCALDNDIRAVPAHCHDDYDTRLWDVLFMAVWAIKTAPRNGTTLAYRLWMPVAGDGHDEYDVKLVTGPGDDGEPVVTLMRPDED